MPAALIGGTGLTTLDDFNLAPKTVQTEYGPAALSLGDDLVFINRHAPGHTVPPHNINARAQIKALSSFGVKRLFCLYAVGLINPDMQIGVPVLITDFIDLARRDGHTVFDTLGSSKNGYLGHVDMSAPFCPALNAAIEKAGLRTQSGIYACTQGPRLETPAEIRALAGMGADVVGMTLSPEVPLARECGMSVCAIALPVNWAAGVRSDLQIDHTQFRAAQNEMVKAAIKAAQTSSDKDCRPAKIF